MSTAPPYQTLLYELHDRVARLTLNRPDRRNAISHRMRDELVEAVERAAQDPGVHAVIIRGAGSSFCSGYDIGPPYGTGGDDVEGPTARGGGPAMSPARHALGALQMARAWARIWDAPIPVIAQVHGYCLAGGTDIAQNCDLIIVAEDATIGFPALRMGGTPPTNMWLYNVGPQWTKRLLFTGDTFTGRLAARIGFALEAVPSDRLDEHVMALAQRIAMMGRDITAVNKHVVNQGLDLMGRHALQGVSGPMDALANQSAEMDAFRARAEEVGLANAFKERDAPFREGVPLDI